MQPKHQDLYWAYAHLPDKTFYPALNVHSGAQRNKFPVMRPGLVWLNKLLRTNVLGLKWGSRRKDGRKQRVQQTINGRRHPNGGRFFLTYAPRRGNPRSAPRLSARGRIFSAEAPVRPRESLH